MEALSFKCSVCQIYLDGIANYQRHVNSLEHANRIHLKTLENITDEDKACSLSDGDPLLQASSSNTKKSVNMSASMVYNSLLKCEPCQKQFSGNEPFRQHLESAGHKKKLAMSSESNSNLMDNFRCDVCDKNFSGPIPYEQHMISSVHKKKLIQKELNQKENPFASFLSQCETDSKSGIQSSISQDTDLSGSPSLVSSLPSTSIQNNVAIWKCDICDKCFSGPMPYNQHMSSNVHMKKVKEKEILDNMQSKTCNTESMMCDTGINVAFSPQNQLKCEVCDKTFSGPVPLQQHLISVVHQKKVEQQELFRKWSTTGSSDQVDSTSDSRNGLSSSCMNGDEQMSDLSNNLNKPLELLPTLSSNQIGSLQFKCDACDKSFTGRVPYDQHIVSVAHQKKILQKTPMSISNNSSPKNEMSNPLWYCKMCDKQCSGAVPFTQHKMSDAHCKKMRIAEEFSPKKEGVDSTASALIDEHGRENCIEGNLFMPREINTERMSPRPQQTNSDLIMGDVLKDLNFITPETLNVTTFNVNEKIVFDAPLR